MHSLWDVELARGDAALPGLPVLLDPVAFLAALRRAGITAELEAPRISYVKYRPGKLCRVGYELKVGEQMLPASAIVCGRGAEAELRATRERPCVPGPAGPGRVVLDDGATVVFFFPNDGRLTGALCLAEAESTRGLLRELFPACSDLWEGQLQRLRYRVTKRYVAALVTPDGRQAALKFYPERAYARGLHHARAFQSRGALRVARPLGFSDRHCVVAFEWLPGRVLSVAQPDPQVVTTVGAALAEVHTHDADGLKLRSPHADAAIMHQRAEAVAALHPPLASRARELAHCIAGELLQHSAVSVPLHGDVHAKQILVGDQSIGLIDFDAACRGHPALDLSGVVAQWERLAARGRVSREGVDRLVDALLDGYGTRASCDPSAAIPAYTAANLLRGAANAIRRGNPDWPARMEALIGRAEAILHANP